MTADEIKSRVQESANARLPEVIEKLFPIMQCIHAHDAWRGECWCSYCHYIRHHYIPFKLRVHKLKKRIRYLEWANNDVDIRSAWMADQSLFLQQMKLREIKNVKKKLKKGEFVPDTDMYG